MVEGNNIGLEEESMEDSSNSEENFMECDMERMAFLRQCEMTREGEEHTM